MFLPLLVSAALAGDLLLDATVPVELRESGEVLVQTWGPGTLRLVDLRAGPHLVELVAGGRARTLTVEVPDSGGVRLRVLGSTVTQERLPPGPPSRPVLELKSGSEDSFALVLDGERRLVFSDAAVVQLEGITPGEHALEIRSADLLTIWSRGALVLDGDARVVATARRGQTLDVFGPEGAWVPSAGAAKAPPEAPTPPLTPGE